MFRRLAEAFTNDSNMANHTDYVNKQNIFFNSLPNMVLSETSGLNGFDTAIQSVDSQNNSYQQTFTRYPNTIFLKDLSPNLNKLASECSGSSLDELIASKNPNIPIGCGWLYTPPEKNSPYPNVSRGFIGNVDGPLDTFNPPDYKKWFFDLQLAKKQVLIDKCKAMKACTDLDSEVFKGSCGFCTDTNQGVPIDNVGKPLYGGDPLGTCSPQSIIKNSSNCPAPEQASGPQPIIDRTCEPVNGRLSASCLYNQVINGGCSNNGSLALALSGSPSPNDYIANLRDADSVKIYNRTANPPLKLDIFAQGATTVDAVLKEVRQISANTNKPDTTGIGAAARDLCLQKGAITRYDFCNDLSDSTIPPFNIDCLQQIFRKMGGQPSGLSYPQSVNINIYNSWDNLGKVKQYFNNLLNEMKSNDYETQRHGMMHFLGIQPEKLVSRAPFVQGVEVIWFLQKPGTLNVMYGILKRTIESNIVRFNSISPIPQLASTYPGFTQYASMIQMTDIRPQKDLSTKFAVHVDDGFFIAVNQPANISTKAFNSSATDEPGLFSNLNLQGTTKYISNTCIPYSSITPNITKLYYSDGGGGTHCFEVDAIECQSGKPAFSTSNYSLTLETRAPFLNLEVLSNGNFDDTRNPGLFSNLIGTNNLDIRTRSDERNSVPGNKNFARFVNTSSYINLINIAYQSWATATFAFRLQSMPVKDAFISFFVNTFWCTIYLVPINGSTIQMKFKTNMTRDNSIFDGTLSCTLEIGQWYHMSVSQYGEGFDIYCDKIENIIKSNKYTTSMNRIINGKPITTTENYGLYMPGKLSCSLIIGGQPVSNMGWISSPFIYDFAWVHFFDYIISSDDIVKDCKASWIFTEYPDSYNNYKVLG